MGRAGQGASKGSVPARRRWSLLLRLLASERARIHAVAAELGLSPAQAHLLWELRPGEPAPMSALADALACHASNVTGLVDRLEAQGLVARGAGRDRRVKTISLTREGRALRRRMLDRLDDPPPAVAALTESEQARLLAILTRAFDADAPGLADGP